ncbi:MAG TPA: hypothetical protein VGH63_00925, partial [Polyangia bacterium]
MRELIAASLLLVGCTYRVKGVDTGGAGGGGGSPIPVADAGVGGNGGNDDLSPRNGSVDFGPPPVAPCYSEDFSPATSLADLRAAYAPQAWKADVLESLKRRIAGGHALLMSQQNDSQLANFVDTSSFDALMSSLMMVCNGETSIYDYAHATPSAFTYFLRADLTLQPAIVPTFARSELAPYITDGATSAYDGALSGQQGSEDITAVADDIAAFTNGVACIGAVTDQLKNGISARDGMAASIYYLELYLKRARTAHLRRSTPRCRLRPIGKRSCATLGRAWRSGARPRHRLFSPSPTRRSGRTSTTPPIRPRSRCSPAPRFLTSNVTRDTLGSVQSETDHPRVVRVLLVEDNP